MSSDGRNRRSFSLCSAKILMTGSNFQSAGKNVLHYFPITILILFVIVSCVSIMTLFDRELRETFFHVLNLVAHNYFISL